jgi:predicted ATPase
VALGRELRIREPSPGRFLADFGELCGAPLGAADYGALAARCGVLALRGVPALTPARADEARRFVTLVDELYEARVLLLLTADAPLERLFPDGGAAGWGGDLSGDGGDADASACASSSTSSAPATDDEQEEGGTAAGERKGGCGDGAAAEDAADDGR